MNVKLFIYNKFILFFKHFKYGANFLKLVLGEINNNYKFSIKERILGARLVLQGYKNLPKEESAKEGAFDKFTINHETIYVPSNAFKKGELSYLYTEVFDKISTNPHAYECGHVGLCSGDVVLDVGACEGFFSFYSLKKNVEKIYLFEPLKVLCDGLEKTLEKEISQKKIFIIKKGLSDKQKNERFTQDAEYICMSKCDSSGTSFIELISLDEFVSENKINKLDFIKMDIEGAEVDAIKGARNVIKTHKPKLSIAVYHNYENAFLIKQIIQDACPEYKIFWGGCYMFEKPYRPYMLYAYV